ncbi:hypothetical protein GCM10022254_32500 [Actinomadura meridiana]|uniref:Uncharacterized protein n=1 Tax=Actinomadura meridiana TaxID=559626 RepID=A0ABP8C2H5_9ACTN
MTMGNPVPHAELIFDYSVDTDLAAGLEAEFRRIGFATERRTRHAHRGPDEITWLMLAALPLHAFLSSISSEVAGDLYAKAKTLATAGKKGAGSNGRVPLILQDAESGLKVILEADLPPEAISQLIGLELGAHETGPLRYDRAGQRWRPEPDEPDEPEH